MLVVGAGADNNIEQELQSVPNVQSVAAPAMATTNGRPVAAYSVTLTENPLSNAAMGAVPVLTHAAQAALGSDPGIEVYIAGATAQNRDSARLVRRDTEVIIPIVLCLVAVLLYAYLQSVVAAAYLVATVVLSFAASIGLGWMVLHDLIGIPSWSGGVVLYAFVFLVALGEDYNIFMVSRIWQERRSYPMQKAVARGARATGSVITAAGLILAGTFAVLTGLPLQILLEFGVVTALGVLVDTFIVRSALVPALTALLGDHALWPSGNALFRTVPEETTVQGA